MSKTTETRAARGRRSWRLRHDGLDGINIVVLGHKLEKYEEVLVKESRPGEAIISPTDFNNIWEYCRDYSTDYSDMKRLMEQELFCEWVAE